MTVSPALKTYDTHSPAWLLAALRALDHDTWFALQRGRADSLSRKVDSAAWCLVADDILSTYHDQPDAPLTRKALALCAWECAPRVYMIPDALFDTVRQTPLPNRCRLAQVFDWPDHALYLATPPGLLAPKGRETVGVLAFWAASDAHTRSLGLLLNHRSETSLYLIPDNGTVADSIAATRYVPSGTKISTQVGCDLREVFSLLLFCSTFGRDADEANAVQEKTDGYFLIGKRLLNGFTPWAKGRWLPIRDRYAWMIDHEENSSAAG